MSIVIDPNAVREQSNSQKTSTFSGASFSDVMSAANAPVTQSVGINEGYQPAAVTSAAISGLTATPSALNGNAPYGNSLLQANGFNYGSGVSYGNGAYGGVPGIGGYGTSGTAGITGLPGGDAIDRQGELFQKMQDSNWQMLVAQVTVNDISRNYQGWSNILKTKSDAEQNSVRNMKA